MGVDGQPFWYGGVLCYTKLNNLTHVVKDGTVGKMIRDFDEMDTTCKDTVFLSIYDHPHELCCKEFWDEVNFPKGKNPPYIVPSKLRTTQERDGLIDQYRSFIKYASEKDDTEFVTALESMRYEHQRFDRITPAQVEQAAKSGTEANFVEIGGAYCTSAEMLDLMARYLTGRMLTPEFYYGPESDEKSVAQGKINVKELAQTLLTQHDTVLGFKQLKSLYRVGDNFISPVDAYATLAAAIAKGADELELVRGRLKAADNVDRSYDFADDWVLFADGFKPENIFRHTELQTWTLKPAIF